MAAKQSLWEISNDMQALDELLAEADFDDQEVQEALAKWADEITNNLEEKADNYAAFIQTLLARSEARKKEATRLADRARVDENNAKRLKENLKSIFEFRGIKKVETARYLISVAKNGGKQPIEVNVEPADLPEQYRTEETIYKKDSDAIREALIAGADVAGCRLLERGTSLRIK